jgi:cytochrome c biogenesis protein
VDECKPLVAGFSALGTVIEQNKGASWYIANYPVGPEAAFGFIDYPFILDLGLDHIYTMWYFLALLAALAAGPGRTRHFSPPHRIPFHSRPQEMRVLIAFGDGVGNSAWPYLAASLTACTFTRQLPVWKVSANWKFLDRPATLLKMDEGETLPRAKKDDLANLLAQKGYQVFVKGKKLYAFKGLIGRLAPIG